MRSSGRVGAWLVAGMLAVLAGAREVLAQDTGMITGTVVDSAGSRPLEGAQVFILGTSARAVTGATGTYRLTDVPAGTHRVQVRALGYSPIEREVRVAAGGPQTVDFVMTAAPIQLGEIVAVGYGTAARRELATSIASVDVEDIRGVPLAGVDAALQGVAPGVQVVQNAGNPGNGITVRVRGSSSISAGNQPLWVIDGIPMLSESFAQFGMGGQDFTAVSGISLDEVESIEVLKDAAATAIYGSRGSNGVVLVRTRRGIIGEPRLTFSMYAGTQETARKLDLLNAREYLEFFNESVTNDYPDEPDYYGTPGVDDVVSTDWQDVVLRSAPVSNFQLGAIGGDERFRFNITGSYFDQKGIVIGSAYDRVSGRANLDVTVNPRLALAASLGLTREMNHRIENDGATRGIITNTVGNQPIFAAVNPDGSFGEVGGGDPPTGLYYPNPAALGFYNTSTARTLRGLGNVEARLSLTSALTLTSKLGFDIYSLREDQYESPLVSGTYAVSAGGVAKNGVSTANRYVAESFLSFDEVFGSRHSIDLTGGAALELNDTELNFLRGEGLSSDQFRHARNAAVLVDWDATRAEHNLVSFFSRANYVLDGRYILGASLRTDGSTRFGSSNRYGVFPAVSAAWLLSDESFMRGVGPIAELKLRASYGITGNQDIGNYPYQGLVGSANYEGIAGIAPSSLENPDLKWETTEQINFGVDVYLLDGRIGLIADVYEKNTRDLLLNRPISTTSGFSSVYDNVGSIRNRGVELNLVTTNLEIDGALPFRWTSNLNIAWNANEVTKLAGNEPFNTGERSINRVEVGQPLGAFHARRFLGVDPATGDAIYSASAEIVGSPHPTYTGGLTNTFRLGNFDLNVFLQFSHGAEVFNAMRLFSDAGGYYFDNQFRHVLNRWREPGDITDVPRASYDGSSGARTISSRFIEDGSYVRLQDLRLAWRVPATMSQRLRLRETSLFVSGRNLHTWTDYMGYTPDVNSNGSSATASLGTDFYAYPQARTITFGIQGAW